MFYDEHVHTDIVIAFYRAMQGDRTLFLKCVQQYGEERGRRMAMRAMRLGYPLTFNAYQACGEWASTRPELAKGAAGEPIEGCSHSLNMHCLWCEEFALRNAVDIGRIYCGEIDRSIVRGFNPDMIFEVRSNLHDSACCDFVFGPYDPAIQLKRPEGGVKDFNFHCAHMYYSFAHTVQMCTTDGESITARANEILCGWHTEEFFDGISNYVYTDFVSIPD